MSKHYEIVCLESHDVEIVMGALQVNGKDIAPSRKHVLQRKAGDRYRFKTLISAKAFLNDANNAGKFSLVITA